MKKSAENTEKIITLMKDWQVLEDQTIAHANEILGKSPNQIIKMTMEMIRNDSEKHKILQQVVIDHLTKEPVRLTPEHLMPLSDMLGRHMEAEARSLILADKAVENSGDFITSYILSYLIADETKHHSLLNKLNELKRATVFVT